MQFRMQLQDHKAQKKGDGADAEDDKEDEGHKKSWTGWTS